jgi:hypothetical protein
MCSNEALSFEQNTITYPERYDAPRQGHSSMFAMQYTTGDSSHNENVHANNTHTLTSRTSTTQLGHPLPETLLLTSQALAQHDIIHTSADADKGTKYLAEQRYGPGTNQAYVVGERACVPDEYYAIQGDYFSLHEHSHNSTTHVINNPQVTLLGIDYFRPPTGAGMDDHLHPYPMTIYEADVNDQSRQVNFSHEERVVVKHMQAHDWSSVSDNFHGIGVQFDFLSL